MPADPALSPPYFVLVGDLLVKIKGKSFPDVGGAARKQHI